VPRRWGDVDPLGRDINHSDPERAVRRFEEANRVMVALNSVEWHMGARLRQIFAEHLPCRPGCRPKRTMT